MSNSSSPEPTTNAEKVKNNGSKKRPEPLTTLPNLVTDEEGTAIPEASDGSSMYQYRDFSNVPEEELEQQPTTPPPTSNSRGAVESSIRVQKFPVKLYAILAQKEFQDIITWMPHGRSWKVLKPNLFESLVMPLFFEYSNYHSFNRLVNAWSFRRISSGPDRGSYYHELFLRGKPYLQKYMRRLPKTHKKLPMKKNDEPDFYGMDKANPLPTMEEVPLGPTSGVSPIGMPLSSKPPGMSGFMGPMQGPSSPSNYPGMTGLNGMSSMASMSGMGAGVYKEPSLLGGPTRHMGMGMGMGPSGMGGIMGGSGMMGGVGPAGMMGGGISFRESQFAGNMCSPMSGHMGGMGMTSGMGISPGMGMSPSMGMSPGMGMSMGGMGYRESHLGAVEMGMGGPSMGGMAGIMSPGMYGGSASAVGDMAEYQRLRQIQQMHMLDRQQMAGPVRRF